MSFGIINRNLLKPERIAVESENDLVVLHLGSTTVKLPYQAAFQLSQWLRVRAKEAKRFTGDTSQHWSLLGVLKDLAQTKG